MIFTFPNEKKLHPRKRFCKAVVVSLAVAFCFYRNGARTSTSYAHDNGNHIPSYNNTIVKKRQWSLTFVCVHLYYTYIYPFLIRILLVVVVLAATDISKGRFRLRRTMKFFLFHFYRATYKYQVYTSDYVPL